jgi:hypothetical protein
MLQGKGTDEDPLVSSRMRLMDVSLMMEKETMDSMVVITVEQITRDNKGELYAMAFEIEDIIELIERIPDLLEQ